MRVGREMFCSPGKAVGLFDLGWTLLPGIVAELAWWRLHTWPEVDIHKALLFAAATKEAGDAWGRPKIRGVAAGIGDEANGAGVDLGEDAVAEIGGADRGEGPDHDIGGPVAGRDTREGLGAEEVVGEIIRGLLLETELRRML